jgi:hypothetical protein
MTTAYDLVRQSLLLIRAIDADEPPSATEAQDGLRTLNAMLDLWRIERLMTYVVERLTFPLVVGTQTYTLGPGGTWNTTATFGPTTRPVEVQAMGLLDTSVTPACETPMEPLTQEAYQGLRQKTQAAPLPTHWRYEDALPLGSVFVWPVPAVVRSVALYLWRPLARFATIHDDVTLAEGYEEAIVYNLGPRLAPMYGVSTPPEVLALAIDAKALVKRHNTEVGQLEADPWHTRTSSLFSYQDFLAGRP